MNKQIFVNLPVKNLDKSVEFFTALGYTFNAQYTNEKATCMVISENSIYAMLLVEAFFQTFTTKRIVDAREMAEVSICLSAESRQEVDDMVAKAVAAGATVPQPPQDYGFMYTHGFEDPDGHTWEYAFMSGEPS